MKGERIPPLRRNTQIFLRFTDIVMFDTI